MEHDFIIITSSNQIGTADSLNQNPISQYLKSPVGRARLAGSMVQPLRTRMDYQSIARRSLLVDQLPSGAIPSYGEGD